MDYHAEVRRKLLHLGSAVIPLMYWVTERELMLWCLLPVVVLAVVLETGRQWFPALQLLIVQTAGGIMRGFETQAATGASYVVVGAFVAIAFFEREVAIAALLVLSVSDSLASLVGMRVRSARFLGKSAAGCATFFVSAAVITVVVMPEAWAAGLCAAAVGTVVEALPHPRRWVRVDDNLTIPVSVGLVLTWLG